MPALFGRQPGPRQRHDSEAWHSTSAGTTLATWIAAKADPLSLEHLLPSGFTLAEPLLIVEAISLHGLPWLAGRGYDMLLVSTPVIFATGTGPCRGRLELVTWEDCPDAIVSGRDELGWNKVYADNLSRFTAADGNTIQYRAAWHGARFFEMNVTLTRGIPRRSGWRKGPLMHYRVIPRTGVWDRLDVEQVTAHTVSPPLTRMRALRSATGTFRFHPASFEELPTLCHIVNRLADIPLGEVVDAGHARTAGWSDIHDIHILQSSTDPG
ncbi:acetoacetate decarboxylase family protein (plasmid) [Mycolicibacterium psychrotolerans]|uniref:acetoacetate decarboxylase family protein n=1 Tax=Mycolicibacterium psychrotolerans TaxID=216929 RepID=UPI003D666EF1